MYEIIQFFLKKPKKTQKNPKKPKKPKKTQKNPLGWAFLKKPGFFPTLFIICTVPLSGVRGDVGIQIIGFSVRAPCGKVTRRGGEVRGLPFYSQKSAV